MDAEAFLDLANQVAKLKMYPYFDLAHAVVCCLAIKEDMGSGRTTGWCEVYPRVTWGLPLDDVSVTPGWREAYPMGMWGWPSKWREVTLKIRNRFVICDLVSGCGRGVLGVRGDKVSSGIEVQLIHNLSFLNFCSMYIFLFVLSPKGFLNTFCLESNNNDISWELKYLKNLIYF